ncbi:hypothetical protein KIN20_018954 [Parelaphostrongylus tenuis]|uniref:Uncharacterized protein n=1 Tax=Parelaphostrongylus tenuis TaxID=148309 RepID=A0AAD5QSH1_PARTN|nr:hypothetical protein KIN20_018954 [Parelaphostrongylus tenuis]
MGVTGAFGDIPLGVNGEKFEAYLQHNNEREPSHRLDRPQVPRVIPAAQRFAFEVGAVRPESGSADASRVLCKSADRGVIDRRSVAKYRAHARLGIVSLPVSLLLF